MNDILMVVTPSADRHPDCRLGRLLCHPDGRAGRRGGLGGHDAAR